MSEVEAFSFLILLLALLPSLICLSMGVLLLYLVLVSPITLVFNKIHNLTKIPKNIIFMILGLHFLYFSYGIFLEVMGVLINFFGNFISSFF